MRRLDMRRNREALAYSVRGQMDRTIRIVLIRIGAAVFHRCRVNGIIVVNGRAVPAGQCDHPKHGDKRQQGRKNHRSGSACGHDR